MGALQEVEQMVGETVAANNRRFAEAVASADAGAMASVYEDDAELLPPNTEPIRGRESIERFWKAGIEMGLRRLQSEAIRLEQTNELAFETGRFTQWIQPDGDGPQADVGKYVVVHRRQPDGSWRRAVEIFNWYAPLVG
jgi:uncharacterized protein (TIGR02246 family)